MHVHDLADRPNTTLQGNLLGRAGVFLDRIKVIRMGV